MGFIHQDASPLAGQKVKIREGIKDLVGDITIEDWWDRIKGQSWMSCDGNSACMIYGIRSGFSGLPTDNEVLYGKMHNNGTLVHVSELDLPEKGLDTPG